MAMTKAPFVLQGREDDGDWKDINLDPSQTVDDTVSAVKYLRKLGVVGEYRIIQVKAIKVVTAEAVQKVTVS